CVNELLNVVGIGDVARPANRATAECANGCRSLFGVVGATDVAEGDVGTFARQAQSRRLSNAARSARDEDNAASKFTCHVQYSPGSIARFPTHSARVSWLRSGRSVVPGWSRWQSGR